MKKRLFGLLIIILVIMPCIAQPKWPDYIRIYRNVILDVSYPGVYYLVLRKGGLYEFFYSGDGGNSEFGKYSISNDTLCLQPTVYEYNNKEGLKKVDNSKLSLATVPIYLIMKGDSLIDVTDFRVYPEFSYFLRKGDSTIFDVTNPRLSSDTTHYDTIWHPDWGPVHVGYTKMKTFDEHGSFIRVKEEE